MSMFASNGAAGDTASPIDSAYAWRRAFVSLCLGIFGGVGLWSVVVFLPSIEAEFGADRGGASVPYMMTMLGFAGGGVLMGRLADRFGIFVPLMISPLALSLGYFLASQATSLTMFIAVQSGIIGLIGSATTFGPIIADVSLWFEKRRGTAIAIVASGSYVAGTIWPPLLQHGLAYFDWRELHMMIAIACPLAMLPMAFYLRRRAPVEDEGPVGAPRARSARGNLLGRFEGGIAERLGLTPKTVQAMLIVAGLGCCVAMAMPQVHIVPYCADLGYGPLRGAEMLSLMLGLGVASRLGFGWISDRIGGVRTMLVSSSLQCLSLALFLPFDGLVSLYLVSAIFGLSQGGIVPSYAMIIREFFPAREAGMRVSAVLMATVCGMALGGWISGEIYDLTGSYEWAFLNGVAWNLSNMAIAFWLLVGQNKIRAGIARATA